MDYCIQQPGCLGDILFTIKIAEELSKRGKVHWYVSPIFWNNGINKVITSENVNIGPHVPASMPEAETINLCNLTHRSDPELARAKYTAVGMDWRDWGDYVKYDRNPEIELALKNHFGIEDGEPFILYNDTYGFSQKHTGVVNSIPKDYDGKIIKLEVFEGITVIDWAWIFENAEEIHTVDTSILMVIEPLDIKATKMTIHPRHYKYAPPQLEGLYRKPWKILDYDRDTWRECCLQEAEF